MNVPVQRIANGVTSGHEVAGLFQRMLNKRLIPDYFEVIKEPTAFSTVRVCAAPYMQMVYD